MTSSRRLLAAWGVAAGMLLALACSSAVIPPASAPTAPPPTPQPPVSYPAPASASPVTATPIPTPVVSPVQPVLTATPPPPASAPDIAIEATATIGGCDFRLEVADTASERGRGLMERDTLPADQGMLFVYGFEQELNFWMKNTLIPLDIVFIDDAMRVVDVQTMAPEREVAPDPLPIYTSAAPAKFALEISAGVAAECAITPGTSMRLTYLN